MSSDVLVFLLSHDIIFMVCCWKISALSSFFYTPILSSLIFSTQLLPYPLFSLPFSPLCSLHVLSSPLLLLLSSLSSLVSSCSLHFSPLLFSSPLSSTPILSSRLVFSSPLRPSPHIPFNCLLSSFPFLSDTMACCSIL